MKATEQRQRLREVLAADACIRPASVFDPISARIASVLGFQVGMFAGSVASATVLGAPDLMVLTLTEFVDQVRRVTRASDLSLIVDADHGYGNALNVMRTMEELEAAGISALTLEDTVLPMPFRGRPGEEMLPVDAMVGNLKAALAARIDPSLVIVGRTSALAYANIDEAVKRVKAYSNAGVDAIFLTEVTNQEELVRIRQATTLPLFLGNTPPAINDLEYLGGIGVCIALAGHLPFRMAVKAVYEGLKHLKEGGSPAALKDKAASDKLMSLATRQDEYTHWQQEYLG